MNLPQPVLECMQRLEAASFATYAVGGCVRDWLLGCNPHDFDLCSAAKPEQLQELFRDHTLVLAGLKHGTVGVVCHGGVVEITTFRTEGDYTDLRHPGWVRFVSTIEEDLARRDFAVNAMAYSPARGLVDPFGGAEDLKKGILRAVGNPEQRFREDSLRILRGVRFAVRFHLEVEEKTKAAMLACAPLMENLARERVFDELCKMLPLVDAHALSEYAPILAQVIPELESSIGFDQHSPHHCYDLFTHIAHVTADVPGDLVLRWAALLHDVGKVPTFTRGTDGRGHFYGHAKVGAKLADEILLRLKAPTALREQVVLLIGQHMTRLEPERKLLRRRVSQYGLETVYQMLELQEADMGSKGVENSEELHAFRQVRELLNAMEAENACLTLKDLAVSGKDLIAMGYTPGKALGQTLQYLLEQVVDEQLPNDREALLEAAKAYQSTPL